MCFYLQHEHHSLHSVPLRLPSIHDNSETPSLTLLTSTDKERECVTNSARTPHHLHTVSCLSIIWVASSPSCCYRGYFVFFTSTNGNKNKAWDYFLFVLYAIHTFPASGIFLLLFQVHLYTSLSAINKLQELKQLIQRVLEETKRELKRPDMENGTESPVELPRITAVRLCWGRSKRTSWKIVTLNKLESSFKLDFYTRATGFRSSSSSLTSQNPNMSKSIKSEIQQSPGDTTALGHTPDCPQSCLCVYLGMLSR